MKRWVGLALLFGVIQACAPQPHSPERFRVYRAQPRADGPTVPESRGRPVINEPETAKSQPEKSVPQTLESWAVIQAVRIYDEKNQSRDSTSQSGRNWVIEVLLKEAHKEGSETPQVLRVGPLAPGPDCQQVPIGDGDTQHLESQNVSEASKEKSSQSSDNLTPGFYGTTEVLKVNAQDSGFLAVLRCQVSNGETLALAWMQWNTQEARTHLVWLDYTPEGHLKVRQQKGVNEIQDVRYWVRSLARAEKAQNP